MLSKQFIYSLLILFVIKVNAQQEPQFSDYKLNISSFNPAFAGFYDGSVMLIHRTQFVGIDGAPQAQNLNLNLPINVNMGVGLNVINQSLGVTDEKIITGDYSYSIYTNDITMLTFGLKAGVHVLNVDYTRLNIYDPSDMSFGTNIEGEVSPRIGAGVLLTTPKWFLGISTPNFLNKNYNPTVEGSTGVSKPHFYFMTGYNTYLTEDIIFRPSILSRAVAGAPLAIDLALNFDYQDKFRFGASYRWDAAISAIAGISVGKNIQVGYSYDYLTGGLSKYSSGSHQFYLKFTFKRSDELRRICNCSFTDNPDSTLGY